MTVPHGSWRADPAWPDVDVVMPIRNEEPHLASALDAVRAQQYPGNLRVFMGVGPSDDQTELVARSLAASEPSLTVVASPSGRTPSALNLAIRAGTAPIVVRVDGHSQLSHGYVERAVTTLRRTGAVNVGGRQVPRPTTSFQNAVAAATTSLLGTGGASYRVGGTEADVDTVYLGVFERSAIEAVGLFDERLIRNQDYELNIRLRAAGGRVVFDPGLAVGYTPRASWPALAQQYYEYGRWKAEVMFMHPAATTLRQIVPPVAIGAIATATLLAVWNRRFLAVPAAYVAAVVAAGMGSTERLRTSAALATIHTTWVAGLLTGSISRIMRRGRAA